MTWIGNERRTHTREQVQERLRCYVGGRRLDAAAVELSSAGGFLAVDRVLKPDTQLVVEMLRPGTAERAPALVARVVHFRIKPVMGVGVAWTRVVSEDGLQVLVDFLRNVLSFAVDQQELQRISVRCNPSQPVSYDFTTGRFALEKARTSGGDKVLSMFGIKVSERTMDKLALGEVRFVQSEAPRKKRAIIRTDAEESAHASSPGAVPDSDEWVRLVRLGRPVAVPVVLAFNGSTIEAKAESVSARHLFVRTGRPTPAAGTRVLVRFPVKTALSLDSIILVAEVRKTLTSSDKQQWGCSLQIVTVNEGANPGLFKRYVEQL